MANASQRNEIQNRYKLLRKNCVLSLGRKHNVETQNLRIKTHEKVCVVMKQSAELRAREEQL